MAFCNNFLKLLIGFWLLLHRISGCSQFPYRVKVTVLVNAPIMTSDQRNQSNYITRAIASNLYQGSEININEISYTVTKIVSSTISNNDSSWLEKIHFGGVKVMRAKFIKSSIIDRELNSVFTVNSYKEKAEFVVLLVSDKTELDAVSPLLKKKKTLVVVLGSSVPKIFKTVASRDDYLYQVKSKEDLGVVTNKIKEQIACDSNQFCDTDSYSLDEGSKCRSCVPPCSQNTSICSQRCQFMQPKSESSGVDKVLVGDNKELAIRSIIGVSGAFILAIVTVVIISCICKKGNNEPITASSSNETCEPNDSYPVQVEHEAERLIEDQPAAVGAGQSSCADGEGISMKFKNNLELDQNLYANKDHYIDMSKGREIDCE